MHEDEIVLPFPETLKQAPAVTECRSTLLVASLGALQRRGYMARYEKHIDRRHLEAISTAVAGVWLPIELGMAHYRACDALGLTVHEQLDLGAEAVVKGQQTFIGTVLKAASAAGAVNGWSAVARMGDVFARTFHGGGVRVVKTGPKDVRIEVVGLPLAGIPYFRVAYRGFIRAATEFFTPRTVVNDVVGSCTKTTLGYRASWV